MIARAALLLAAAVLITAAARWSSVHATILRTDELERP